MSDDNHVTETDVEKLAIAIARALQQARSVSDSEHYDHHRWITAKIARENAWTAFWEDMRRHVIKWGAVSLITSAGYALWLGTKAILKAAA